MARTINKLSAGDLKKTEPGMYGDGGGLWLQVAKSTSGKGVTKSWLFRFMLDGRARSMGLGRVNTFGLKEARERALKARQLVADGIDPIESRQARKTAARAEDGKRLTFKDATDKYIAAHRAGWNNSKHAGQWRTTLDTYALPVIGDLSVADIETAHITRILEPIWTTKTETASRLRGRIEAVLNWAAARGFRKGENPARWRGHLDNLLAKPAKIAKVQHQPAMPYTALPAFMERLRGKEGVSARALEFCILTAARTGEVIGAKWSEIDLAAKVWTIPGERMKAGKEHRIPLTGRMVELLENMPREAGSDFVFLGARAGRSLNGMAMLDCLRTMETGVTVHGFRSTFRDWAGECTNFPRDLAEAALAHAVGDKVEAAYRRGDALEKRRRLMTAWERYCAEKPIEKGKVIPMQERA